MNSTLKFFLIALLPVAAVTSCRDDDEWKPTWALPIVKEQTFRIGDFITDEETAEVNKKVREEWSSYVAERFGLNDTANVDSVAFVVLTSKDSTYVQFDAQGVPSLNDSTRALIEKNLTDKGESEEDVEAIISQINAFLEAYNSALQSSTPAPPAPLSKAGATPRAAPLPDAINKNYGGDSAVNNLLSAMIHPTDVFITAANLLSTMGAGYLDSINSQIDSLLQKATMTDTIKLDLTEYTGENASITALDISLDINSSLPFAISIYAGFIGANSHIVNETVSDGKEIKRTKSFSGEELDNITSSKEGVRFSVSCRRDGVITESVLRTLSQQTVSFSLRVKIQAPISKLDF
jgi:hypothetical protein